MTEPAALAKNLMPSVRPMIGGRITEEPFIKIEFMSHFVFGSGIGPNESNEGSMRKNGNGKNPNFGFTITFYFYA